MAGKDENDELPPPNPGFRAPGPIPEGMKRRVEDLKEKMRLETTEDLLHFEENRGRKYLIRHAYPNEEEYLRLMEILTGEEICPDEQFEMLIAVQKDETSPTNKTIRTPVASTQKSMTDEELKLITEKNQDLIASIFIDQELS